MANSQGIPSEGTSPSHPSDPGPPLKKRKISLRVEIPKAPPSIHDASNPFNEKFIKKELAVIELKEKSSYISKYEVDVKNLDQCFETLHPNSKVSWQPIGSGTTGAHIVHVDGQPRYILKKIAPRPELFQETFYQKELLPKLQEHPSMNLDEKVYSVFISHSFEGYENSYLIEAQREKLAFVLGKDIGVPKVQLILTEEGIFSLHDYLPAPSGLTGDVMQKITDNEMNVVSLQKVTIFDMVSANRDRNAGNFLLSKEKGRPYQIIPIDHALTLRTSGKAHLSMIQMGHFLPLWYDMPIADELLSQEAKEYIKQFDISAIRRDCLQNNIYLDDLAEKELENNIAKLKKILSNSESSSELISLNQLYKQFYEIV